MQVLHISFLRSNRRKELPVKFKDNRVPYIKIPQGLEEKIGLRDELRMTIGDIISQLAEAKECGKSLHGLRKGTKEFLTWKRDTNRALSISKIHASIVKRAISEQQRSIHSKPKPNTRHKKQLARIEAEKTALKNVIRTSLKLLEDGEVPEARKTLNRWRDAIDDAHKELRERERADS
jgi:hypothetical protein